MRVGSCFHEIQALTRDETLTHEAVDRRLFEL
jgi:hypothetical protein